MKLITFQKFFKDEVIIKPQHPVDIFVLIKGSV